MFIHNSIPETNYDEISLTSKIGGLSLSSPIFINAMTGGGGEQTKKLNQQLAEVAAETKVGMAVGSQMAAIKESEQRESYEIVRKSHPDGIIFANLGSEATLDQAKMAVDMIEANAFQLHLNVIQELVMPEGDRNFTDTYKRIEKLVQGLEVPVIVKEVGYGMNNQIIQRLASIGVRVVDIGGFGGTNFSKIENERRQQKLNYFNNWGITTTASLLEGSVVDAEIEILASGGLQSAMDLAKSLALGAVAGGFAGRFLKVLVEEGQEKLIEDINQIINDLKMLMTALGASSPKELTNVPLIVLGDTFHWATQRGIDCTRLSLR